MIVVPHPTRDMNSLIKEGSSKWVVVSASDPIFCLLQSMFDVGGQRDERRKWIQCFNGETFLPFSSHSYSNSRPNSTIQLQHHITSSFILFLTLQVCCSNVVPLLSLQTSLLSSSWWPAAATTW